MSIHARKVDLISALLTKSPVIVSLFPNPRKVLKQLDRIRRSFLQEGVVRITNCTWRNVLEVNLTEVLRWLGNQNLATYEESMLIKWLWRSALEEPVSLKEVLKAKYGAQNHWCTKLSRGPWCWDSEKCWLVMGYFFPECNLQSKGVHIKFLKGDVSQQLKK